MSFPLQMTPAYTPDWSLQVHHVSSLYFLLLRLRPGFVDRSLHFIVSLWVNLLQHVHQTLAGIGTVIYTGFSVVLCGKIIAVTPQICICYNTPCSIVSSWNLLWLSPYSKLAIYAWIICFFLFCYTFLIFQKMFQHATFLWTHSFFSLACFSTVVRQSHFLLVCFLHMTRTISVLICWRRKWNQGDLGKLQCNGNR